MADVGAVTDGCRETWDTGVRRSGSGQAQAESSLAYMLGSPVAGSGLSKRLSSSPSVSAACSICSCRRDRRFHRDAFRHGQSGDDAYHPRLRAKTELRFGRSRPMRERQHQDADPGRQREVTPLEDLAQSVPVAILRKVLDSG